MGFQKQDEVTLEEFLEEAKKNLSPSGFEFILKAYEVAEKAHRGQKRLSGQPYIIHPINVAYIILTDLAADENMIAAGLLHDVVEDTNYTREDMIRDFGEDVTNLVNGVTKVSKIKNHSKEFVILENIRRFVIASIDDPRVVLIKLADKTHNMRTISFQPPEKQEKIAKEVFSIYAPLAGRLGVYKLKSELEDLAFQVLHPEEYQKIKQMVSEKKSERDARILEIKEKIDEWLKEAGIEAKVEGRAKHFYSIYKKIIEKEKKLDEIFDLRAVRIITKNSNDCYNIMGIIHQHLHVVPNRIKDYISTPKSNGYQSLHTTVFGFDGKPVEIQIRTEEMNRVAEYGIAAHWGYKEGRKHSSEDKMLSRWRERFKQLQENTDPQIFVDDLQQELTDEEVFVFSPRGDMFEFPKGATALDFAFRIHTDVGLHAKGAKINGKIVPLREPLNTGDQVEIITDKNAKPSPLWIRFLKTSSARQKVRQYFRKQQEEFHKEAIGHSQANLVIGEKDINVIHSKSKSPKKPKSPSHEKNYSILVGGQRDILTHIAKCCSPLPGDEIVGFITKGRGVTIHKKTCEQVKKFQDTSRKIPVNWTSTNKPIPVDIEVRSYDRPKIYSEIVSTISATGTNMLAAGASTTAEGIVQAKFTIEIEHLDQLQEIMDSLKSIPNVISVERTKIDYSVLKSKEKLSHEKTPRL